MPIFTHSKIRGHKVSTLLNRMQNCANQFGIGIICKTASFYEFIHTQEIHRPYSDKFKITQNRKTKKSDTTEQPAEKRKRKEKDRQKEKEKTCKLKH